MDREKAEAVLAKIPEYVPGPCPRCGATTFEEAATKCRPYQMPCGDYSCGSPDEGPNAENEAGPLYQRNPEFDRVDGYLWALHAYEEWFTTEYPVWPEPTENVGTHKKPRWNTRKMTPQYQHVAAMVAGPEGLPLPHDFNALQAEVGTHCPISRQGDGVTVGTRARFRAGIEEKVGWLKR